MKYEDSFPVHETAFMISNFRSSNPELSGDHYAYLWNNKATDKWVDNYLKQVSVDEKWSHCLRNRFFLDTMDELAKKNEIEVLINFGAGFSMYPFIMQEEVLHVEIDVPEVIDFKTKQILKWKNEKLLPQKECYSIAVDFESDYQQELAMKIREIVGNRKCFILIEGVHFFLPEKVSQQLFSFFDELQMTGDYLGSVSFNDALKSTQAFKNLTRYFNQHFTMANNTYQTINDDVYWSLPHYQLLQREDYFSLSKQHNHQPELSKDEILNENFYLLRKL